MECIAKLTNGRIAALNCPPNKSEIFLWGGITVLSAKIVLQVLKSLLKAKECIDRTDAKIATKPMDDNLDKSDTLDRFYLLKALIIEPVACAQSVCFMSGVPDMLRLL
jgi:hypothetical protein